MCFKPIGIRNKKPGPVSNYAFFKKVPCGRCFECRKKQAKNGVCRLMMEFSDFKGKNSKNKVYFLTLTYKEIGKNCLEYRDIQLFLKRLRKSQFKRYKNRIKFFVVGEFGAKTHRKHGHMIVYNLRLDDLRQLFKSKKDKMLYYSNYLENLGGLGYVSVGETTINSISYVANYCFAKIDKNTKDEFYPIQRSSQRLGYSLGLKNEQSYLSERVITFGDRKYSIPRYFLRKMRDRDEDSYVKGLYKGRRQFLSQYKMDHAYSYYDNVCEVNDDLSYGLERFTLGYINKILTYKWTYSLVDDFIYYLKTYTYAFIYYFNEGYINYLISYYSKNLDELYNVNARCFFDGFDIITGDEIVDRKQKLLGVKDKMNAIVYVREM